jgi:hypothetical protein
MFLGAEDFLGVRDLTWFGFNSAILVNRPFEGSRPRQQIEDMR